MGVLVFRKDSISIRLKNLNKGKVAILNHQISDKSSATTEIAILACAFYLFYVLKGTVWYALGW